MSTVILHLLHFYSRALDHLCSLCSLQEQADQLKSGCFAVGAQQVRKHERFKQVELSFFCQKKKPAVLDQNSHHVRLIILGVSNPHQNFTGRRQIANCHPASCQGKSSYQREVLAAQTHGTNPEGAGVKGEVVGTADPLDAYKWVLVKILYKPGIIVCQFLYRFVMTLVHPFRSI